MTFDEYLKDINKRYTTGIAREHAYRPSLQNLIESVMPDVLATNDPARIECGAPDFILSRRKIDVGYIEAKDIGNDLDKTEKSEQIKRYLDLDNLILTDYLEFRFYLYREKVEQIRIAEVTASGQIKPIPENFDKLKTLLVDFAAFSGQTITSAKKLAEMMARKARLMRDVFYKAVQDFKDENTLHDQFEAFKTVLVHDMDEKQFADVYAQTVTYGLFTARLHDKTLEDFSRQEALLLIPKSNPFLRQLFHYVTGPDLDGRVVWIVDALCEVYRATDLRAILKDFGTATGQNDPILHFYETFLGEYDKKLKKARGVWFTPEPVVNFIVRAIDDVLKDHFNIKDGLADTSKVKIQVEAQETDKRTKTGRKMFEREVHKVQLLDVATGTGTFLAETVKQVYSRFEGQEGLWSNYVENELLPRLHGFELLMASYAMCHMKLDLLLQETGYKPSNPKNPPRLSVYLTNSLEEHHPDMDTLFAKWLSREANEASRIKKDMPIMVAFGNPPYAVSSSNKGNWIQNLIKDYKEGLNEKKINLDDDYIKFIRYAEHYIEKIGYGVVAMITNNSFLDGITHRQMRKHLLESFDDIYVYDLHGNSKKKETAPDGSKDENVFDIQQGVSISIYIKHKERSQKLGNVYHFDSFGSRVKKYERLIENNIKSTPFRKLKYKCPSYFFAPKNFDLEEEYSSGFKLEELFITYSTGIETAKDSTVIKFNQTDILQVLDDFRNPERENLHTKYNLSYEKIDQVCNDININSPLVSDIHYRPFDFRKTIYTDKSQGVLWRPRHEVMKHFLKGNIGLVFTRINRAIRTSYFYVTRFISDRHLLDSAGDSMVIGPLYLYETFFEKGETKTPNFNPKIYRQIKETVPNAIPENLFDYIYAVLYSSTYRERYSEFLKSNFPRIPFPENPKIFHQLAECGTQLRELHLMESDKLNKLVTTYPADGDNEVKKPRFVDGKVWINKTQFFGNVPQVAWEFYIGGYQPAQKWLNYRKGHKLSFEDLQHWQRIIAALTETDKIMQEIDTIDFLPSGKK
ncbi:MAG: N-6 DNA methylase [Nitrospinota bacterium]|nr:N-6 DNA methylase [Nitrospinota bacterium]